MKYTIELLDKGIAAVSLVEETLTDGSKAYNITIGEHEIGCVCEKRAVQSFTEIANAIRAAAVNGAVII
jgi:hypothetical protein